MEQFFQKSKNDCCRRRPFYVLINEIHSTSFQNPI